MLPNENLQQNNVLDTYSFLGLLPIVHKEDRGDGEERRARERQFCWTRHFVGFLSSQSPIESVLVRENIQWRIMNR